MAITKVNGIAEVHAEFGPGSVLKCWDCKDWTPVNEGRCLPLVRFLAWIDCIWIMLHVLDNAPGAKSGSTQDRTGNLLCVRQKS